MPDHATSSSAAVQAQLDRLFAHGPGTDILGLDRVTRLLARLGDPHLSLPPVFHVAGTNGKGSTCAFLRAALEAAGHDIHVYSSPHLVRFNERIRLAGRLIDDEALAALLAEVLDAGEDIGASFFEATTAAAFLAFARTPAAATIVEVGLGGRLDATNVVRPIVTGIAALGLDHQAFLGDTTVAIAGEKAGIAKPRVPLVTMDYAHPQRDRIAEVAAAAGAPVLARGRDWSSRSAADRVHYTDARGEIVTPRPRMVGAHQSRNLGLAIAMLRHQEALPVPEATYRAAAARAHWPGRLQRLGPGPLTALLAAGAELWIDGAHNPQAAAPLSRAMRTIARGRPVTLVIGMLANKDASGVLRLLAPRVAKVIALPVPAHDHHAPDALAALVRGVGAPARTAETLDEALTGAEGVVLVAGSLYLAGTTLDRNDERPT